MKKTINEIAKALGLSRNTVSKVINGKAGVSNRTVELVERYLQESEEQEVLVRQSQSVNKYIVFTYAYQNTEYFSKILTNVEETLQRAGYGLILNMLRFDQMENLPIPVALTNGMACGVISFNIFDSSYWQAIIEKKVPAVFIDTFYKKNDFINLTDIVTVESETNIRKLVQALIEKGIRSFGYVGDPDYCYSIYRRYLALCDTLTEHNMKLNEDMCVLDYAARSPNSETDVAQRISPQIRIMKKLPQVFICANDVYATVVLQMVKELGYQVPADVSVIGFDNSSESLRQQPPITTIDAHADYVGMMAANMILNRIENPDLPNRLTFTQSDIVLRQSTDLEYV